MVERYAIFGLGGFVTGDASAVQVALIVREDGTAYATLTATVGRREIALNVGAKEIAKLRALLDDVETQAEKLLHAGKIHALRLP